jgi:Trk K+ transport system NAD-binding subunit
MARKIKDNEFAVIGPGRFGSSLARRLEEIGHTVLVADINPALLHRQSADQLLDYPEEPVLIG